NTFYVHADSVIDVVDVAITLDQLALAVDHHRMVVDEVRLVALVVQDVVPDHFHTVLRDREGNPRHGARYAVAIGNQLGPLGIGPGGIVDTLRIGGAAAGRIDLQVVIRMALQQI